MSSTIRFIANRSKLSFIAYLTLFVLLGAVNFEAALGQSAPDTDRGISPTLSPMSKFLVKDPAQAPRAKMADLRQFRSTRSSVQIQLSDSKPIAKAKQQDVSEPVFVASREFWQDDDRGTDEVPEKELIERIRQPLPDNPLQKLTAYPQPSGEIKQFSKEPQLEKGKVQFPERFSREYFGQNKVAGPWILEDDFALNSPISQITDYRSSNTIYWGNKYIAWASPNARSYPLYFEQINMERYGNQPRHFATALSAAHFFGTLPFVPFKMGNHPPRECMYTLGHFRPGSCNPSYRYRDPITGRAILSQAAITAAVLGFLPP